MWWNEKRRLEEMVPGINEEVKKREKEKTDLQRAGAMHK